MNHSILKSILSIELYLINLLRVKSILKSSNNSIVAKELPENQRATCIVFDFRMIFCHL